MKTKTERRILRALTISQPFASLIASGEKWVENRTWPTKIRGEVAVHAGKGIQYLSRKAIEERGLPFGQVVALANLVACVHLGTITEALTSSPDELVPGSRRTWREVDEHAHKEGPWCWLLEDVKPLKHPIDAKGALGLWDWRDGYEQILAKESSK